MLKGRTALVTGSTGGIGEAFARTFAAQGCNVMLNGFGEAAEIERLRSSIAKEHGVEVAHHGADVGVPAEIEAMVREVERRFGHVDILVNNAVIRHYDKIEDFPVEKWDRAIAVGLSAAFHTIRLTIGGMKTRKWGRIINMSSIHGRMAVPNRVDYVTSKHALIGMTRAVALECAQDGVTINALMPGWVLTPHAEYQVKRLMEESRITRERAIEEMASARQPSHKPIMPSDIAAFGVFLCSDAGAHITGAALPIDGAWQAGHVLTMGSRN
jgi:3-hydroxybutyrate dehydrogenase